MLLVLLELCIVDLVILWSDSSGINVILTSFQGTPW